MYELIELAKTESVAAMALAFMLLAGLVKILNTIRRIARYMIKLRSIKINGYPPSHCDALGEPMEDEPKK